MKYQCTTFERFAELLASGYYRDGAAARRAIGKMATWSIRDYARAHRLVDTRFGPSLHVRKDRKGTERTPYAPQARAPRAATPPPLAALLEKNLEMLTALTVLLNALPDRVAEAVRSAPARLELVSQPHLRVVRK